MDGRTSANERQVGGEHYRKHGSLQHWDVVQHFNLDYFQGNISKYVFRWRDKGGIEDLKKARHYLDKYIENIEKENAQILNHPLAERDGPDYSKVDDEGCPLCGATGGKHLITCSRVLKPVWVYRPDQSEDLIPSHPQTGELWPVDENGKALPWPEMGVLPDPASPGTPAASAGPGTAASAVTTGSPAPAPLGGL